MRQAPLLGIWKSRVNKFATILNDFLYYIERYLGGKALVEEIVIDADEEWF